MSMEPSLENEMMPFSVQPSIFAVDTDDKFVPVVGSSADPWIITVSLVNMTANLINNVTCEFKGDGLCTFENLAIDTMGSGYILDFEITYPTTVTIPSVQR